MNQLMQAAITKLSESEATYALREGWYQVFNSYPSDEALAILWAQSALETGRWKSIWNYNFGNIKKTVDHDYCMYHCSEIINGKNTFFDPPHPQTHFNSYSDAITGAKAYIEFVSQRPRYRLAWQELYRGNPIKYCVELKKGGYFTANLVAYTSGVVSLVNEFKNKKNELLSWKPVVEEIAQPNIQLISPEIKQEPNSSDIQLMGKNNNFSWLQLIWQFICQIFKLK